MKRLDEQRIRPTCRAIRGELAAFYEACDKLRDAYTAQCRQADGHRVTFALQLHVVPLDERGLQGD